MDVIDKITKTRNTLFGKSTILIIGTVLYTKLILSGFVIVYHISMQALSLTQMRDVRPPLPPKAAPPVPPPRRHKVKNARPKTP